MFFFFKFRLKNNVNICIFFCTIQCLSFGFGKELVTVYTLESLVTITLKLDKTK